MTPEELAERHPKLYHVTEPGAWENIKRFGLLSTSQILDLFEIHGLERAQLETKRRATAIALQHASHGQIILNDNIPLNEKALEKCLDDHLTPADWLRLLNSRVFFWASEEKVNRHLEARLNRTRKREVLVVDTLKLAKTHSEKIELCPINSGASFRKAARRGLHTFTPMLKHPYSEWSKLRGKRDTICEVTVLDHVMDIEDHVIQIRETNSLNKEGDSVEIDPLEHACSFPKR